MIPGQSGCICGETNAVFSRRWSKRRMSKRSVSVVGGGDTRDIVDRAGDGDNSSRVCLRLICSS